MGFLLSSFTPPIKSMREMGSQGNCLRPFSHLTLEETSSLMAKRSASKRVNPGIGPFCASFSWHVYRQPAPEFLKVKSKWRPFLVGLDNNSGEEYSCYSKHSRNCVFQGIRSYAENATLKFITGRYLYVQCQWFCLCISNKFGSLFPINRIS